jgi:hypothetical protein
MDTAALQNLIRLKKNPDLPYIYDVELNNVPGLRAFDSVEVHLVLYPFARQVIADNYLFTPFEDYANDISTRRRSLYTRVPHPANSLFGIFLGIVIILFFLAIKPSEVYSLQSIVAILGAYFIGKDLWDDLEALFVAVSQAWRVRYQRGYYAYQVQKNTTLTNYSALARVQRYGKASLQPEQMEFISNANSKTARLKFSRNDLHGFQENTAHILGIRLDPALADEFASAGFMFSVKVSFNETAFGVRRSHEFFQSLNAGERGCLDLDNQWTPDAALAREAIFLGNLRYLASRRLLPAAALITSG